MTSLFFKMRFLACSALVLLCACGDIVSSSETYSQRCSDNSNIVGYAADFGGYKKGKKIPFKHSDGYLFSLTVTERKNSIDYSCQKHLKTTLESAYPIYFISLASDASTFYYSEEDKKKSGSVDVVFGQYAFSLPNPLALQNVPGSDSSYIDTMKINGVVYTGVAVSNGRKNEQPDKDYYQDASVKSDAKLYYNTKKGILKIELEDGSHIAINEEDD